MPPLVWIIQLFPGKDSQKTFVLEGIPNPKLPVVLTPLKKKHCLAKSTLATAILVRHFGDWPAILDPPTLAETAAGKSKQWPMTSHIVQIIPNHNHTLMNCTQCTHTLDQLSVYDYVGRGIYREIWVTDRLLAWPWKVTAVLLGRSTVDLQPESTTGLGQHTPRATLASEEAKFWLLIWDWPFQLGVFPYMNIFETKDLVYYLQAFRLFYFLVILTVSTYNSVR